MIVTSRKDLLALAILALIVVVYANSLENSFHYDDSHSIVENPHIRSLANLPSFFLEPETFSGEPAMAMYRPVLVSSFASTTRPVSTSRGDILGHQHRDPRCRRHSGISDSCQLAGQMGRFLGWCSVCGPSPFRPRRSTTSAAVLYH